MLGKKEKFIVRRIYIFSIEVASIEGKQVVNCANGVNGCKIIENYSTIKEEFKIF